MRLKGVGDVGSYQHIFLSPHLDDAALSCGATIAGLGDQGLPALVVTLCTADPDCGPQPDESSPWHMARRRSEDEAAMEVLEADFFWAGLLDAPFRDAATYGPPASPFVPPSPGDDFQDSCIALLRELARRSPSACLHAPLGVGGHTDHVQASRAALAAAAFSRTLFYEDFPYVLSFPNALDEALRTLPPMLPRLTPVAGRLEAKLAAILRYQGQIELLFGSAERARSSVKACARSRGSNGLFEREWEPAQRRDSTASR